MIPSPIAHSSTEGVADDKGLMIAKMVPLRRLGQPEEIAAVAGMFARVGYCTGQVCHSFLCRSRHSLREGSRTDAFAIFALLIFSFFDTNRTSS